MTQNDDVVVRVQLLVSPCWNVAHRHENRLREAGRLKFPLLANVEEKKRGQVGIYGLATVFKENFRRDFGIEHDSSIPFVLSVKR